jgi:hypothetical protein
MRLIIGKLLWHITVDYLQYTTFCMAYHPESFVDNTVVPDLTRACFKPYCDPIGKKSTSATGLRQA